jgi:hypothetical protein
MKTDANTGSKVEKLRRLRFRLRELNSAITSLEGIERIRKRPSSGGFAVDVPRFKSTAGVGNPSKVERRFGNPFDR